MENQYEIARKSWKENFINPTGNTSEETALDEELLLKTIPEIAKDLLYDEFGITYNLENALPITFMTGWQHALKFIDSQPEREFSIDLAGLRVGYVTDYSGGEKINNVQPIIQFVKEPVFVKNHNNTVSGVDFTNDLLQKYNSWRSVNLEEIVDKIERDTHAEILDVYGIDLIVPQAVMPIMAAMYAVGLQIAKEREGEDINMYNIFNIKYNQGHFFAKELALIKMNIKGDGKNQFKND